MRYSGHASNLRDVVISVQLSLSMCLYLIRYERTSEKTEKKGGKHEYDTIATAVLLQHLND